jgi:hypothetical protein
MNTPCSKLLRWAGALLVLSLGSVAPAYGQATRLSVSSCFSPLLVTSQNYSSETNWEWFYLSVIDSTNYSQVKANANTSALLPYGFFTGDFAYFNEQRQRYFEMHNESLKYYQAMTSSVSYLPPSWQPTIQKCIEETLRNSSNGLSYLTENVAPEKFRLEIKYRSTEGFHFGPYVKSSEIDGGYVLVDGKQRRTLYSDCWIKSVGVTCPNVDSQSEFTVIRDNPNKPVSITLNLSNWEHSTAFDVDIVPKQIKCDKTYEGQPKLATTLPAVPVALTEQTIYSGGWEAGVWTARAVAPGRVTLVTGQTFSDATNMHLLSWTVPVEQQKMKIVANDKFRMAMNGNPDWQDDVVLILGTQNGGPPNKTMDIKVEYQLPKMSCTEQDWK